MGFQSSDGHADPLRVDGASFSGYALRLVLRCRLLRSIVNRCSAVRRAVQCLLRVISSIGIWLRTQRYGGLRRGASPGLLEAPGYYYEKRDPRQLSLRALVLRRLGLSGRAP